MTKTLHRIVLSALLLCAFAACRTENGLSDDFDDDPVTADGIGTSPSACVGACDPEGIAAEARRAPEPGVAPPNCGVWFDASSELADLRALACHPPEVVVHVGPHATCVDALASASTHGGMLSVVRRLAGNGAAIEADCP